LSTICSYISQSNAGFTFKYSWCEYTLIMRYSLNVLRFLSSCRDLSMKALLAPPLADAVSIL
jgi:hypothetical protein